MNFTGKMPINWFDVVVLLTLLIGFKRGQTRGMSQESLAVLKWIGIVILAAIAYEPLGSWLSTTAQLSKLLSYVIAYAAIAGVVTLIFVFLDNSLGAKLKGSDTFGSAEFHLGKPAGMVRFLCVLLTLMALLNARYYSTAEVRASQQFQNDNYGSNFFPTLSSIQDGVFRESFLGKQAKEHISFLFIKPTPATGSSVAASGSSDSKPASKTTKQRDYNLP